MPERPCEGCGTMTNILIRRSHVWWIFSIGGKWHWSCPECSVVILDLKGAK